MCVFGFANVDVWGCVTTYNDPDLGVDPVAERCFQVYLFRIRPWERLIEDIIGNINVPQSFFLFQVTVDSHKIGLRKLFHVVRSHIVCCTERATKKKKKKKYFFFLVSHCAGET